jgi:hypothetical protein
MNGEVFGDRTGPRYSLGRNSYEASAQEAGRHEASAREPSSFEPGPLTTSPPPPVHPGGALSMRTVIYFFGLLIILAALAWAALLLGVPSAWIGVGLLFGLGIILIKGTRYTPHRR